ncbi:MAG TPA: CBS domain-containing protein [Thermoanaerobaculia bacterium]
MRVKDVMTKSPVCCGPAETLDRVAKMMLDHDCGVIPICTNGALSGVITDRDITCRAVAAGKRPIDVAVSDVMTKAVFTVQEDDDVQMAIDVMEAKQVRRLPVLDKNKKVVGIVAPSDLAPTFASMNVADFLLRVSYWTRRPTAAAV